MHVWGRVLEGGVECQCRGSGERVAGSEGGLTYAGLGWIRSARRAGYERVVARASLLGSMEELYYFLRLQWRILGYGCIQGRCFLVVKDFELVRSPACLQ